MKNTTLAIKQELTDCREKMIKEVRKYVTVYGTNNTLIVGEPFKKDGTVMNILLIKDSKTVGCFNTGCKVFETDLCVENETLFSTDDMCELLTYLSEKFAPRIDINRLSAWFDVNLRKFRIYYADEEIFRTTLTDQFGDDIDEWVGMRLEGVDVDFNLFEEFGETACKLHMYYRSVGYDATKDNVEVKLEITNNSLDFEK